MENEIERIRRTVGELRVGTARRYPRELKVEIVRVAEGLRAKGWGWQRIATQLGMPKLKSFVAEVRGKCPSFVPVRVVEANTHTSVAVVSPGGYRVEGLGLAEAAELLRRLA
jgi:transposase